MHTHIIMALYCIDVYSVYTILYVGRFLFLVTSSGKTNFCHDKLPISLLRKGGQDDLSLLKYINDLS